jgi:hypothetical protein
MHIVGGQLGDNWIDHIFFRYSFIALNYLLQKATSLLVFLLESLILLLQSGVQFFQFLVVVLQGLDLKLQFLHLLVVIDPLCFDLNLHLLLVLLCDRLVVVNQCSASCSHIIFVYYLRFLPFVPLMDPCTPKVSVLISGLMSCKLW